MNKNKSFSKNLTFLTSKHLSSSAEGHSPSIFLSCPPHPSQLLTNHQKLIKKFTKIAFSHLKTRFFRDPSLRILTTPSHVRVVEEVVTPFYGQNLVKPVEQRLFFIILRGAGRGHWRSVRTGFCLYLDGLSVKILATVLSRRRKKRVFTPFLRVFDSFMQIEDDFLAVGREIRDF